MSLIKQYNEDDIIKALVTTFNIQGKVQLIETDQGIAIKVNSQLYCMFTPEAFVGLMMEFQKTTPTYN